VATQFDVQSPRKVATGTSFNVMVTALNGLGGRVKTYSGPVTVSINGSLYSTIPSSSFANGQALIPVTLSTPSTRANPTTLTVADDSATPNASLTKTVDIVAIDPTVVTGFTVSLSPFVQINKATTVYVTPVNGLGAPVTDYPGPITASSSSDTGATISTPTLLANGTFSFSVTFDKAGFQSLTVSDTNVPPILTQKVWTDVISPRSKG